MDTRAITVAQEDQKTFTDLVRQLVAGCANDVEKARAIFRWITVKNLNSLMFEDVSGGDTPLGKQRLCRNGTTTHDKSCALSKLGGMKNAQVTSSGTF